MNAVLQAAQAQARAGAHQPERQRGHADALQGGGHGVRKSQPDEIGQQPGEGADDQRTAQQLAAIRVAAVRCQRPDRGDVAQRHAQRDAERHPRQARRPTETLGERERDERVEADAVCAPEACSRAFTPGQRLIAYASPMP
jgi:hypothetical protein